MNVVSKELIPICGFVYTLCMSSDIHAYEIATHSEMSNAAYDSSVLSKSDFLKTLGITATDVFDESRADPRPPKFNRGNARGWVQEGAVSEDANSRPANHFYNPITGQGIGGLFFSSPDWALEDEREVAAQEFSYRDARQYFYDALTKGSKDERERNVGRTFETLGHVIHHIQDMAQPQHVRNDLHCDLIFPCKIPGGLFGKFYNPSLYEKYTDAVRDSLPYSDYVSVYPGTDPTILSTPRKFWRNIPQGQTDISQGKGIAEFTNLNFLSAGTNFIQESDGSIRANRNYGSPVWNGTTSAQEFEALLAEDPDSGCRPVLAAHGSSGAPLPPYCYLHGKVVFYATSVEDKYAGTRVQNDRASTLSIFDQDLENYDKRAAYRFENGRIVETKRVFTLNRFNFQAAYPPLIPKAVAYNVGRIDDFFVRKTRSVS